MRTYNFIYQGIHSLKEICQGEEFKELYEGASGCLVQVYSGRIDAGKLESVGREILKLLPKAQVIGASTAGEILEGKISEEQIVISISLFEGTTLTSRLWTKRDSQTDEDLGKELATGLADQETKLLLLFSTALTVEGGALMRGVWGSAPDLPVAGGGAGDNNHMQKTLILHGAEVSECGVVTVSFHGDRLRVWCRQSLGWQPVGRKMSLDRVEGNRLLMIDGQPAGKVYDRYLGAEPETGNVSERARDCPLIINRNGMEISRIAAYRLPDGSLAFPSDLKEGEQARFSVANIELMLETASTMVNELSSYPIEASFIFSCTARRGALLSAADQETYPLRRVGTVAGFYTYGEYFHHPDCNLVLNGAMTVVSLSEEPVGAVHARSETVERSETSGKIPSSMRVFATVAHLLKAIHSDADASENNSSSADNFVFINTGNKTEKIFHSNIIAVEAEGNYTRVFLRDATPLLVRLSMKKWVEVLPAQFFLRLSRSLIVQIKQISHWENSSRDNGQLHLADTKKVIPVTRHSIGLLRRLGLQQL